MVHGKLKHTKLDITPLYNLKIINLQKLRTDIRTLQNNRNGIIGHNALIGLNRICDRTQMLI